MKLWYYQDPAAREEANRAGRDYTPAYLPVMLRNMGVTGTALPPDALRNGAVAPDDTVLFGADTLGEKEASALKKALKNGAFAIGFGTVGGPFGKNAVPEPEDICAVAGYFTFSGSDEPLPVLGSFARIEAGNAVTEGTVKAEDGVFPVCLRSENAVYFPFDLPATLWRAADGRPTTEARPPFPFGRVPDGSVLPADYDHNIAYADCYQRYISALLLKRGIPSVFPLPPKDGKAAELLLYFAGDDDCCPPEVILEASGKMAARGLPYHINMMPSETTMDCFSMNEEQIALIRSRGQELAVHYNFACFPYDEEGWKRQNALFAEKVGGENCCPVNHALIQLGSNAERCRREEALGHLGDNSKFQYAPDPNDINAFNVTGFAFGSAFPRFTIDDAEHGNRELKLCEVYNSYFEPRIREGKPEEYAKLYGYLDAGAYYGRTLQFFLHPHYLTDFYGPCLPTLTALDAALAHVKEKGWNTVFLATDALTHWWHDRAACRLTDVTAEGFTAILPAGRPFTLRLPDATRDIRVDGKPTEAEQRNVGGAPALLLTVPGGTVSVTYRTDAEGN